MKNMSPLSNPMPLLDAERRRSVFDEVALGYTEQQAIDEARRCLGCKNMPCVSACPVGIRIPEFIALIADGKFEQAYDVIAQSSSLPAICGRVCPQETQCESKCVRGAKGQPVAIGNLERFVADRHSSSAARAAEPNGHKVAVVGSGPAGLACAGELAGRGYEVSIFEALHAPGGVLEYGIPEFRLPKAIVRREIEQLKEIGVRIQTDSIVGRTETIDDLLQEYEAVFIGSGAGLPNFMGIPGENSKGVYSANEFLTRINLMKAYLPDSDTPVVRPSRAVVVGGGNVAMDAARCAVRLGAQEVSIVYRRSETELPARREEVRHAREEGVLLRTLCNPVRINAAADGSVQSVDCVKMTLAEPDSSGRRRPVKVEGSEFSIECDCVIIAIGTSPNPLIRSTTDGLQTSPKGGIITDERGRTSRPGVYAGGDAVTGAATVILAMGAGKTAAQTIDEDIRNKTGML